MQVSNPGPLLLESNALPTELPAPNLCMNFPLSKSFSAAQQLASPAKQKSGGKGHRSGARSTSSRSYSSSSSSSDSESEQTARGVAQSKVVVLGSEQPKVAVLPVYHALGLVHYVYSFLGSGFASTSGSKFNRFSFLGSNFTSTSCYKSCNVQYITFLGSYFTSTSGSQRYDVQYMIIVF